MKVLILGGSGMLGHKAYQVLSKEFDSYATFRDFSKRLYNSGIFDVSKILDGIDIFDFETVKKAIQVIKPNFIINCIGIIKQLPEAYNYKVSIMTNSLFPHLLAEYCDKEGIKFIHISTDCVFSGRNGNYSEDELSDADDLYGKSKFLGEINYGNTLTLRTSIIGHELFSNISLVNWFIQNKNKKVNGYTNAIYTGFPTFTFCKEIIRAIKYYPNLKGLYNISSEKISKFELLKIINHVYNLNIEIIPYDKYYCDRSLNSLKYRTDTGFKPYTWEEMITEMYKDFKKIK
jgi:dTDP-4-dehydrorhamnose reductase